MSGGGWPGLWRCAATRGEGAGVSGERRGRAGGVGEWDCTVEGKSVCVVHGDAPHGAPIEYDSLAHVDVGIYDGVGDERYELRAEPAALVVHELRLG